MKLYAFLIIVTVTVISCTNTKKNDAATNSSTKNITENIGDTAGDFFPVTAYLKGEIYGIKNGGITPIKKVTIGNRVDSSWIKMEELENTFIEFTTPTIDTTNLKTVFEEKRFLDQTLNAFTFTYDPININSNSFPFTHWDVYVDPDNNKVTRIYLLKKVSPEKTLQLTWQSGKWCKIVTLKTDGEKTAIEKEEKIYWTFEQ
jgi:hypothetical protein